MKIPLIVLFLYVFEVISSSSVELRAESIKVFNEAKQRSIQNRQAAHEAKYEKIIFETILPYSANPFKKIKLNARSDILGIAAHLRILEKALNVYEQQEQMRILSSQTPWTRQICIRSLAAYLKYCLKRHCSNSVFNSLRDKHFRTIISKAIGLKSIELIEVLLSEVLKDFDIETKFYLFKKIMKFISIDSFGFLLLLQEFMRNCENCFLLDEMFTIHSAWPTWHWELFLAPIHFALIKPSTGAQLILGKFAHTGAEIIKDNTSKVIAEVNKLVNIAKILSKCEIISCEEFLQRGQVIDLILRIIFADENFLSVLNELIKFNAIKLLELTLFYSSFYISDEDYILVLDYAIFATAIRLTSAFNDNIDALLVSRIDLDIILLLLNHKQMITHAIFDNFDPIPDVNPLILNFVIEMANEIIAVINGLPDRSFSFADYRGGNVKFIRFRSDRLPQIARPQVLFHASRIILLRSFRIPLQFTRLTMDELFTWNDVASFVNFHLNGFASSVGIQCPFIFEIV